MIYLKVPASHSLSRVCFAQSVTVLISVTSACTRSRLEPLLGQTFLRRLRLQGVVNLLIKLGDDGFGRYRATKELKELDSFSSRIARLANRRNGREHR